VADADAVVAAVEEYGVRSQVYGFIHNPWVQAAKQAVEAGTVGELTALHCDVMFAKGYPGTAMLGKPRKQDPHPRRFTFTDSKPELRTTGVYAVGLIRWITGAEVETVFGVTANYFFAEHQRNDVEDFGVLALTLSGGITATVACGRIGWTSHPAGGPNRLHIMGTDGSVVVDAHKPRIEVSTDEPPWKPPPVSPADPMSFWRSTQQATGTRPKANWVPLHGPGEPPNDASRFIDCIESERESEMPAKEGATAVEILMAGYISAARGEVISLPLPR
jgi:predicted dehydrogenase